MLTDHSPRLTVARGLSPDRLREQLAVVARLNEEWAPFRLLTGIECDILADGSARPGGRAAGAARRGGRLRPLQAADGPKPMTRRLEAAVRHPRADVLGHCTGRLLSGRGRPESRFDAERVFAACAEAGTAVEINCRPERRDPPLRLLRTAVAAGTLFAIDTDAHAPGPARLAAVGVRPRTGVRGAGGPGGHDVERGPVLEWPRRLTTPEAAPGGRGAASGSLALGATSRGRCPPPPSRSAARCGPGSSGTSSPAARAHGGRSCALAASASC
ncbi:hypothetical protein SCALM49S_04878 [Streptomyces californicus]